MSEAAFSLPDFDDDDDEDEKPPLFRSHPFDNLRQRSAQGSSGFGYSAMMIVPTGIGATIGGFAGDALPVAKVMASVVDTLITHPNVMNGASLYWPLDNVLYTEGYTMDKFGQGEWGLLPLRNGGHRIGLLLDKSMSEDLITRHVQAADAARATLGILVSDYLVTDEAVGVRLSVSPSGASVGTVDNPDTLLRGARRLVEEARCTAVAVVCRFPDSGTEEENEMTRQYMQGKGVDPVGGAEAIISRLITATFGIPCAHAPANEVSPDPEPVSAKAAAEELGFTYLPCVLAYLHRAPAIIQSRDDPRAHRALWADQLDAVVIPGSAAGGAAVVHLAIDTESLVVAVDDNESAMRARPEDLRLECVRVRSYLEAVGLLAAHRAGVNPAATTPDVPSIRRLPSPP